MPGRRVRAWSGIRGCLATSPVEVQGGRGEGGLVRGWGSLAFPGLTCRGSRRTEILRFRASG